MTFRIYINPNHIIIDAREELSPTLSNAHVKQETERHHSFKISWPRTKDVGHATSLALNTLLLDFLFIFIEKFNNQTCILWRRNLWDENKLDKVNMTGETTRSFKGPYWWMIGPQLMFILEPLTPILILQRYRLHHWCGSSTTQSVTT
jgi:hypothetical protein